MARRSPSRLGRRTARTDPTSISGRSAIAAARPITTDHRSVFGSWVGDMIVGSTVVTSDDGLTNSPAAFVLATDGREAVSLPQAGLAWRPVVDPTGGAAVYWAGTLEPTDDDLGWRTDRGRLVIGRWSAGPDASDEPGRNAPDAATRPSSAPRRRSPRVRSPIGTRAGTRPAHGSPSGWPTRTTRESEP